MIVTSVSGHLMEIDFSPEYRSWHSCSPESLFTAPIVKTIRNDATAKKLEKTLIQQSRSCQWLILWLDCDREGENIAFEVKSVCEQANARLETYRAKFSALIPQDIHHAMRTLVAPDQYLSDAVDARSEIDLRLGAAFTRFQTLFFQTKYQPLESRLISYGPCQFPTLGFVVDRYLRIQAFRSEAFWSIRVVCNHTSVFQWSRQRLFDRLVCLTFYQLLFDPPIATIQHIDAKNVTRRKPFPLATVELQKRASRWLRFSSDQTMRVAEALYNKGIISYPRTETQKFKDTTDFNALLDIHRNHSVWGSYVSSLTFEAPRAGPGDDQAHPPIHPTKCVEMNSLASLDEQKLYELVCCHFFACCSQDAKGHETKVWISVSSAAETFHTRGLMILERNYLDIYKWEKWSGQTIPVFQVGDTFAPTEIQMTQGSTEPPKLLTEADLIALMDQNGIGTDATIAQHIQTIQQRDYVTKLNGVYFQPTNLGLALIQGYDRIEPATTNNDDSSDREHAQFSKPHLRAEMEKNCHDIALRRQTKQQVVSTCLTQMKRIFQTVLEQSQQLDVAMAQYYTRNTNPDASNNTSNIGIRRGTVQRAQFSKCGQCQAQMDLRTADTRTSGTTTTDPPHRFVACRACNASYSIPRRGDVQPYDFCCPLCQFQVIQVQGRQPYTICPFCYNHTTTDNNNEVGGGDGRGGGDGNAGSSKTPCFKCSAQCRLATAPDNTTVMLCPETKHPCRLRRLKNAKYVVSCTGYPACTYTIWLPSGIQSATVSTAYCSNARCDQIKKLQLTVSPGAMPPDVPLQFEACCKCDPLLH